MNDETERRCDTHEHCEGNALHIRARAEKGCAQLQDGSWIMKASWACHEPHLGTIPEGLSEADVFYAMVGRR